MTIIDPSKTLIYHITHIDNLEGVLTAGELLADALLHTDRRSHIKIGYAHIKESRLKKFRIACCGNRFVGEFVPFYFCPRSPMLYTINIGKTGREAGCQKDILHLVSTVQKGYDLQQLWAISDGNAGAQYTTFSNDGNALNEVNWEIVQSRDWGKEKRVHVKATEFLIADRFPVAALVGIGCHNEQTATRARNILAQHASNLRVEIKPDWYY